MNYEKYKEASSFITFLGKDLTYELLGEIQAWMDRNGLPVAAVRREGLEKVFRYYMAWTPTQRGFDGWLEISQQYRDWKRNGCPIGGRK